MTPFYQVDAMPEDRAERLLAKIEALGLPHGLRQWAVVEHYSVKVGTETPQCLYWVDTANGDIFSLIVCFKEEHVEWMGPPEKLRPFMTRLGLL